MNRDQKILISLIIFTILLYIVVEIYHKSKIKESFIKYFGGSTRLNGYGDVCVNHGYRTCCYDMYTGETEVCYPNHYGYPYYNYLTYPLSSYGYNYPYRYGRGYYYPYRYGRGYRHYGGGRGSSSSRADRNTNYGIRQPTETFEWIEDEGFYN